MRAIFSWMLLIPLLVISQTNNEYSVIENGMMIANPKYTTEFEAGVASHNNIYHTDGMYGSHIYQINNGPNYGQYVWVMGPIPWSAFDERPQLEGHDEDWNANIEPYTIAGGVQIYWRFYPELSNFSNNFIIKNVRVEMFDIKRFQDDKVMKLVKKVHKVMKEKYPDESFGLYKNEFPSETDGRDLAFFSFYQDSGWLGKNNNFPVKFDEVHGKGSYDKFLMDWGKVTNGKQTELWSFREDLSGIDGEMKVSRLNTKN